MGQTLTHGIYLPDEGERNCYDELASNWSILDGAVGTVAEHSTQIAGKAPAVHTHTKSDITDFPVYGTTAGTICEGNDSRLSDARTPVAHTHLTADVTDLLNTAHEWTKEQVCDEGFTAQSTTIERCVTPATIQHINFTFKDKNGKGFGAVRRYFRSSGEQQIQIFGNTRIKDGQYDETGSDEFFGFSEVIKPDGTKYFSFDGYLNNSIRPRLTNTYQLGDSSYQWKSVYAQTYYYNGVAWGLDKANTWTGINLFTDNININKSRLSGIRLYNNDVDVTANSGQPDMTVSDSQSFISFKTKYQQNSAILDFTVLPTSAYTKLRFATRYHTNSSSFNSVVIDSTVDFSNNKSFAPASNNDVDLGTSTNKWKTLNGINPGALSLPNKDKRIAIDTTGWTYTGSYANRILINNATQTISGWLYIRIENTTVSDYVTIRMNSVSIDNQTFIQPGSSATPVISVLFPVAAGIPVYVYATKAPAQIYLYECLGNV